MSNIITINDTQLQVIEYQGQRVATHAQIDTVHKRPVGTAGRNFREHKHRLKEGEDYITVGADEFRRHLDPSHSKFASEDVILMTEQGYLMLVKSFTDDLAWQVQRQLVNGYFRAKEAAALPPPAQAKPARASERYREAAVITREQLKICKLLGVDEGMAKVITAKEVRTVTGLDYTPLLTNVTATNNPRKTPKELAALIDGATSEQVNSALAQLGFQVKENWTNAKGQPRSKWVLTEAGEEYGALMPYQAVEHQHAGYRPAWLASVIDLIRPLVEIAIASRTAPKPKRKKVAAAPASEPQGALL